ncbi:hypothetical protein HDV00_008220 [Rhizophlyctis rosea]|nr:hypothetical protein HDV00_008220 [Rhizophlyctis rosea]
MSGLRLSKRDALHWRTLEEIACSDLEGSHEGVEMASLELERLTSASEAAGVIKKEDESDDDGAAASRSDFGHVGREGNPAWDTDEDGSDEVTSLPESLSEGSEPHRLKRMASWGTEHEGDESEGISGSAKRFKDDDSDSSEMY